jgi:hypothetical protein
MFMMELKLTFCRQAISSCKFRDSHSTSTQSSTFSLQVATSSSVNCSINCRKFHMNIKNSNEICALLGYYAVSCGNCLPTFRDNVSVPSSLVKSLRLLPRTHLLLQNLHYRLLAFFLSYSSSWPVKMGPICCPETSVNNYRTTPHNIPEGRRSHQHRSEHLKSKNSNIWTRFHIKPHSLALTRLSIGKTEFNNTRPVGEVLPSPFLQTYTARYDLPRCALSHRQRSPCMPNVFFWTKSVHLQYFCNVCIIQETHQEVCKKNIPSKQCHI